MAAIDGGRSIDWGRTSSDYAVYRPGPPDSFYQRLQALGAGLAGQRVLDLGTGTGVVARQLAAQGCIVAGIDVSAVQIATADQLAASDAVPAGFAAARAEHIPFRAASFEVVTANQCWLYFDAALAIAEVRRVLAGGGVLVTSHFSWLPRLDPIAAATEALVLRHNPGWSAADWSGYIPAIPPWAVDSFELKGMFWYDEPIAFTAETWRGRMRACRGVGASLPPREVERFDAELGDMLSRDAGERFTVLHRIDAHLLLPR
jgi:SAM-dependent methyltransferase